MSLTAEATIKRAIYAQQSLITLARKDCALFCELALRDEETGDIIHNTPMHEEWHDVADTGENMVVWAHPESGKTQQLAIGRAIWLLGRNNRTRIAILAAAERQAIKILSSIRQHIEENPIVHAVFPNLKKGAQWTENQITVQRDGIIKDPSVQVVSPSGKVQGARLDFLFVDDVLTEDNTRTDYQREKISTWIKVSAFSRLTKNAQIIFLANAWHPNDMAHELARQGWWNKKYAVYDALDRPTWPERWPTDRIEKQRNVMGSIEFGRMMMCEPRDDSASRFRRTWIQTCKENGDGYPMITSIEQLINWVGSDEWRALDAIWRLSDESHWEFPPGFLCVTGVDLGVSKRDSSDPSVFFTALCWPDGTRQVLDIQRGRFTGPEILRRTVDTHKRFRSIVVLENNSAQDFLLQWLKKDHPDIPVKGFRTGRNKLSVEYGVESLAAELERGQWLIPNEEGVVSDEVGIWIEEMLNYDPQEHTGDCLMAAWFCRETFRALQHNRGTRMSVRMVG